ncbi:hypothetical protein ACFLU8_04305 [Chloroflexota bacterium]
MTPLQKCAWYGLAIGVVLAIAILVVSITREGVTAYTEDPGMRAIVASLFVGGLIAYLIVMHLTLHKPCQVDERDRLIMGRHDFAGSLEHYTNRNLLGPGANTSYFPIPNTNVYFCCQYTGPVCRYPDWLPENGKP